MPWHYKVSRQSAATHWICQTCRKYTGSVSNTNDILNIKPNQMVKYSRTTPWTSCHAWPNHMWPWQPNSKVSSTNITIVIIHSIQNCRNMLVNYVLHSHDIIMERYAYKKHRMETDNIPGDPTPISFQRCPPSWMTDQMKLRCHGQMNKLLSPSIVHYKSDFVWTDRLNPLNAPRQRPDITRNKIWNQLINHNVFRKTAQMKQLYRRQPRR